MGIDLNEREDVAGLAEDLRWVRRVRLDDAQREIDRKADRRERRARLQSAGLGLLMTLVGGTLTYLLSHSTFFAGAGH